MLVPLAAESFIVASALAGATAAWLISNCASGRQAPRKAKGGEKSKSKRSVKSTRATSKRSGSTRAAGSKSSKSSRRSTSKRSKRSGAADDSKRRSKRSAREAARSARKSAREHGKSAKESGKDAVESLKDAAHSGKEAVKRKAEEGKHRMEPAMQDMADKARSAKETVKEKALSAKETVKEKTHSAKESVKEGAQQAKESVQTAAPGGPRSSAVKTAVEEHSPRLATQETQPSQKERSQSGSLQGPIKEIHMEPQQLRFSKDGGLLAVVLHNPSGERQAIKTKCSDNRLYRVNPVFGFVEPGGTLRVDVSRQNGNAKADKLVFVQAKANVDDTDPQTAFKKNVPAHTQRLAVLPLLA